MRLFLVLCIWFAVIGGIFRYVDYADNQRVEVRRQIINVAEPTYTTLREDVSYSLSFVTSFTMEDDPFALKYDDKAVLDMLISLNGITLDNNFRHVLRGVPMTLNNIHGLRLGVNELYIQMHPPAEEVKLSHGFHISLKADGKEIFTRSVWNEPGEIISEVIVFSIQKERRGNV